MDFEKRIADIYQTCRKREEIQAAFDQLQLELSFEINEAMTRTRRQLLENFDDEVREKLRVRDEASREYLNRFESLLMQLSQHELHGHAEFLDDSSFRLLSRPFNADVPLGIYELPRRSGEAHLYRLNHPLAEAVIARAKQRPLQVGEIIFDYGEHDGKISLLEPMIGKTGWLTLSRLTVESFEESEDHLLFAAVSDDGQALDDETAQRLLTLPGRNAAVSEGGTSPDDILDGITRQRQVVYLRGISERNARFFEDEVEKLDGWAEDIKLGLERDIKEIDRQIKEARRAATLTATLEEKIAGQKLIKALDSLRNQKRRSLFDAQDDIDRQRQELIEQVEAKLTQNKVMVRLFTVHWRLNA